VTRLWRACSVARERDAENPPQSVYKCRLEDDVTQVRNQGNQSSATLPSFIRHERKFNSAQRSSRVSHGTRVK
jgi:hypothetical protein